MALISATVAAAAAAFIHFTFPSLFSSIQQIRVCFQPASLPPPVWLSDDENSNVVDRGGGECGGGVGGASREMEGKIKQLFHFQRHHMILAGYWLTILRELLLSSPFGETGFWRPPPPRGSFHRRGPQEPRCCRNVSAQHFQVV